MQIDHCGIGKLGTLVLFHIVIASPVAPRQSRRPLNGVEKHIVCSGCGLQCSLIDKPNPFWTMESIKIALNSKIVLHYWPIIK